jgi:hypothetical protein
MSTWTPDDLATIAAPDELEIATRRRDGTLRNRVTIWMVRHGDNLYVRSVNGPTAGWYRGARTLHQARVSAGGLEKDVDLVEADPALADQIDKEYQTKYGRYSENTQRRITSSEARSTTLRLVPRS